MQICVCGFCNFSPGLQGRYLFNTNAKNANSGVSTMEAGTGPGELQKLHVVLHVRK